jgi:hypothetical protein
VPHWLRCNECGFFLCLAPHHLSYSVSLIDVLHGEAKAESVRAAMSLRGVTAHEDPSGTLQFFRLEVILGRRIFLLQFSMTKFAKLLIGAAGGLAGAALMGEAYKANAKLVHAKPPRGEDATEKVANAIAKKFTGGKWRPSEKKTGGQIVHYAFGASMGMLYAALADSCPATAAGCGALFGLAVYAGAHGLTVPAFGLAPNPLENGAARECAELSSHIAFGLTTGTLYRLLSR